MRERAQSELLKSNSEEKMEKGERVAASRDDRAKGGWCDVPNPTLGELLGWWGERGRGRGRVKALYQTGPEPVSWFCESSSPLCSEASPEAHVPW